MDEEDMTALKVKIQKIDFFVKINLIGIITNGIKFITN
jgi:hypothetical protein